MSVYQDYKPSGGGEYLKLKDGDKVKLRVASNPAISVYKEGDKPRYSWVVFNRDESKPQVYTAGISVYRQIADLTDEWGEPTEFDVTIKRTGSGMNDTEYSVVPVKTSVDLTKDELDEVKKVDLLQAIKGKWLADYADDAILPEPVSNEPPTSGYEAAKATAQSIKETMSPEEANSLLESM